MVIPSFLSFLFFFFFFTVSEQDGKDVRFEILLERKSEFMFLLQL